MSNVCFDVAEWHGVRIPSALANLDEGVFRRAVESDSRPCYLPNSIHTTGKCIREIALTSVGAARNCWSLLLSETWRGYFFSAS